MTNVCEQMVHATCVACAHTHLLPWWSAKRGDNARFFPSLVSSRLQKLWHRRAEHMLVNLVQQILTWSCDHQGRKGLHAIQRHLCEFGRHDVIELQAP